MNPLKVMEECAQLALLGKGKVKTNPVVGAIIVKDNKIISRGFHSKFGGAHAEVDALANAVESVIGGDMYVTLEPCSHHGKTPPCVDAIIKAGIKRVFIGIVDPNPVNAGKGMKLLEKSGIEVFLGYCEPLCASLIEDFTKYILKKKPYFSLKVAQTIDGKIATYTGDSKWITSESSREYVHYLRSISDGILVGSGTVEADNPSLDIRFLKSENEPYKIVLDSNLEISLGSNLVSKYADKLIVFTNSTQSDKQIKLSNLGVKIINVSSNENGLDLNEVSTKLAEMNMMNILIEGGSHIFASFIESGLVDRFYSFIAPKLLGGGKSSFDGRGVEMIKDAKYLTDIQVRRFEEDILISGKLSDYITSTLELTESLRNRCSRVL